MPTDKIRLHHYLSRLNQLGCLMLKLDQDASKDIFSQFSPNLTILEVKVSEDYEEFIGKPVFMKP